MATIKVKRDFSVVTQHVANIGTSYDVAKYHKHDLTIKTSADELSFNESFFGEVAGFYVYVDTMNGVSSKPTLTLKVTMDEQGDYSFFPSTEAEIDIGITTSTKGSAVYEFKLPMKQLFKTGDVWMFIKLDQGNCRLTDTIVVWG
jgi:hypothetical protein